MPYKDNPHMLRRHQREWASYPEAVRARLSVVIGDDASQEYPAHEAAASPDGYEMAIYRVQEPMVWGHFRARNLAMEHAPEGMVLLVDIDHLLPADAAEHLLEVEIGPDEYGQPHRVKPDGTPHHPHHDTYFLSRALYWRIGGMNLDYAGLYGAGSIFTRRIASMAVKIDMPDVKMVVFNLSGKDLDPEVPLSASRLPRKGSLYHSKRPESVTRRMRFAHLQQPRDPLRFNWTRVL